jgi:prepilin-type N-terminal cleavage/methylation domain-containing protein
MKANANAAGGFNLIELLLVMAVIAILAAILVPTLKSARDRARRTTCVNNLRQITLGVRIYSDDANDVAPSPGSAAASTNILTLYAGYKELMKNYVGLKGASSPQDKLFACPADTFYPNFITTNATPRYQYLQQSLHDQPIFDFSSYAFNGGDNITRMTGNIAVARPGLTGVRLSAVKHPSRTVLMEEVSALVPWSWHAPSSSLWFTDAGNMIGFVDGHVSYTTIYWDSTPLPGGGVSFALAYDPPANYDYQWSGN